MQLRTAGDIARATFRTKSFPCPWTLNIKVTMFDVHIIL
jgi:hypothetical protein